MRIGEECRTCLFNSQSKKVEKYEDSKNKEEFLSSLKILCDTFSSNGASPLLMREINRLHEKIFSFSLDYSKEKVKFNSICLSYENEIEEIISSSEDSLKKAIQFAIVGNLIDFAKLTSIDIDLLKYFKEKVSEQKIDDKVLTMLKEDLSKSKKVTYLLDNCGEVVFDKILIKEILRKYPHIELTAVVRGKEIINDVTYFDSKMISLDKVCKVIDNGTDIPGTHLEEISSSCLDQINSSEVIISKGLGNFETLHGCNKNIYYMFLCKCDYFANKFNLNKWESVLTNEKLLDD